MVVVHFSHYSDILLGECTDEEIKRLFAFLILSSQKGLTLYVKQTQQNYYLSVPSAIVDDMIYLPVELAVEPFYFVDLESPPTILQTVWYDQQWYMAKDNSMIYEIRCKNKMTEEQCRQHYKQLFCKIK